MLAKPSRKLWIAAIVVAVVCISGLAYGLITDWNTPAEEMPARTGHAGGSGFGIGLMIGIGAGIALGSLIALRKR